VPRQRWTRWGWRAAALGAGALLGLVFSEAGLWWWAYVGLAPVLVMVAGSPGMGEALWRTWFAAFGFVVVVHHWLAGALGFFLVLVVAASATAWLPFGAVAYCSLRRVGRWRSLAACMVLLPAVWVVTEVVRSVPLLAGSWGALGLSQSPFPAVLGVAALGGVWLLSALLVATNVAAAVAVLPGVPWSRRVAALAAAAALVGAGLLYGATRPDPDVVGTLRVAGVQPGVVDDGAARLDAHITLTEQLPERGLDLVVWGQSSVAFDLDEDAAVRRRLQETAEELQAGLLVNTDGRGRDGRISKTSVLIRPGIGPTDRYTKQRLVPFGEYIPARPVLGWLGRFTAAADEDRQPGSGLVVMDIAGVGVGTLISYESTFADLRRAVARRGAELIVVQASSTTFQGTWAQPQQAQMEAVRAAESGRPSVLVAVSGTSAVFDAGGRRLAWLPASDTGTFVLSIPVAVRDTPFVRYGDWVPASSAAVCVLAAARWLFRRRRAGRADAVRDVTGFRSPAS
jgi:apolipoprotein N-acyltransferase